MIYEHALDLVDVTTKALKAAIAVRSTKGSTAIPHVDSLVQSARGAWNDACSQEATAWAEAHAPKDADGFPQEVLPLTAAAPAAPADPEAAMVPPLEAQGLTFSETAAHAALPDADAAGAPPLEPQGDTFEEIEPPVPASAETGVGA